MMVTKDKERSNYALLIVSNVSRHVKHLQGFQTLLENYTTDNMREE